MLALALVTLVLSGCSVREAYEKSLSLGFPSPVTDRAQSMYEVWLASAAAAAVVGVFVAGLILFAAVRYRKAGDELPRQVRYNLPIEVLYTVVPFVIVAVLFYYTVVSQNFVNKVGSGRPDVNVAVVGFQWNWQFAYVDEKVQITGETGKPAQLVLPVGRTVRFTETSPDVVHSFYVPDFLFKRDVVPGRTNVFEVTLRKPGEFIGRCAEYCGEKHAFMNFSLKVVPQQEYDAFIAGLKADPKAAVLTSAATTARSPS